MNSDLHFQGLICNEICSYHKVNEAIVEPCKLNLN